MDADVIDPRKLTEPASERELQSRVERLAKITGWLYYHTFDSRRSTSGFPVVTLCKPARGVVLAELKSASGKLADAQREWLLALAAAGETACLWRPRHMNDIASYLAGERRMPPGIVGETGWDE